MSQAINITMSMAMVILRIIGLTHEEVLEMGWPGSYEFYCPSMFDVKLSYDPHGGPNYKGAYCIKSYPSDPIGNMLHFLRFHIMWTKGLREDNPPSWMDYTDIRKSMYQYIVEHKDKVLNRWLESDALADEFAVLIEKVRVK